MIFCRYYLVRGYHSFQPNMLSGRGIEKFSIGKYLRATEGMCPKRNHILGEYFCKFASIMHLYTNPLTSDAVRNNSHVMHVKHSDAIKKLSLKQYRNNTKLEEKNLDVISTGEPLPNDLNDALRKWKYGAFDEVAKLFKDSNNVDVIDNTIVNFNYSLIGWYLQTYGMRNSLQLIEWLGLPVMSLNSDISNEFWPQPKSPLLRSDEDTQNRLSSMLDGYKHIENKLQYQFHDKSYLLQAFTHETFTKNDLTEHFKCLDFVGDAIGNYVMCRHLIRDRRYFSAENVTDIIHQLTCDSMWALIAVRNEFHKYLRHTSPQLRNDIASFVALLQRTKFRTIEDYYIMDRKNFVFEVPPAISGCFEALIAAVYFDSSMSIETISNTLLQLMHKDIDKIIQLKPKSPIEEVFHMDRSAKFSQPITIAPGQISVTLRLPKYKNQQFTGYSRDANIAKWAAAKSAVLRIKQQENKYIPKKAGEIIS